MHDRVGRKSMCEMYGVGFHSLGAVKSLSEACVRVDHKESEMFKVNVDLR